MYIFNELLKNKNLESRETVGSGLLDPERVSVGTTKLRAQQ